MELYQKYIDLLDAMMEDIEIAGDGSVVVQVQTVKLKLKSVEQLADWISDGDKKP